MRDRYNSVIEALTLLVQTPLEQLLVVVAYHGAEQNNRGNVSSSSVRVLMSFCRRYYCLLRDVEVVFTCFEQGI